jgi:hypothetical protein
MIYFSESEKGFYLSEIHGVNMPDDVVIIKYKTYQKLLMDQTKGFEIIGDENGYPVSILPTPTIEQIIGQQYDAIDKHISNTIKANGDYDNLGEISLYLNSTNFRAEAQALMDWIEQCHIIQADIKNGVQVFGSVEDAINELPLFTLPL